MKQEQDLIDLLSPAVIPDPIHRVRRRHTGSRTKALSTPGLKLASMIDVVFLLLIFFVATTSFQIDEGGLLAAMPGSTEGDGLPPTPIQIDLTSSDDGVTYSLLIDGVPIDNASALSARMTNRVATGQMASDDLVNIRPQSKVRWQHVLNMYNACVAAELG